ncbi:hypothetical protein A1O1_01419 [Capronia coronata CBS 617.96]|uniref:FAD dependent oxidoreductase domain-containing protein n=1 Tax=Capronia coronata CBS 617.96 TaxID=1182541 RepID=W9YUV2_9EURO|nr:uncharacterized protein A1O1_01419 [Capronia coronata CBS 617.96]EXJ96293.1 hypothetical protein A1O1_01419 [Capronia coronata CBS 617.96]
MADYTSQSILVVGAGTFGISTAYHLSLRGYKKVTLIDRFSPPSTDAAGTDINKTIRFDYDKPQYAHLAEEAMEFWTSNSGPLAGLFHRIGWIMAASDHAKAFIDATYQNRKNGKGAVEYISPEEIQARFPEFKGNLKNWKSLWGSEAGWAPSDQALVRLAAAASINGVNFTFGKNGHAVRLLNDTKGNCDGVVSQSGAVHTADKIILACGPQTENLIDTKSEISAKAMCVAMIQLTEIEREKYGNLPMVDHFEMGKSPTCSSSGHKFPPISTSLCLQWLSGAAHRNISHSPPSRHADPIFHGMLFPPDQHGLLKVCSCRYVTNRHHSPIQQVSIGRSHGEFPDDRVPTQIQTELRAWIRELLPELADRPFCQTRMCWDAATKDSNFRLTPHPAHPNLFIATGGSLHGFKFLPNIGKYIVDMVEGRLDPELQSLWAWRFGSDPPASTVERHPFPERDLGELDGWNGGKPDRALL